MISVEPVYGIDYIPKSLRISHQIGHKAKARVPLKNVKCRLPDRRLTLAPETLSLFPWHSLRSPLFRLFFSPLSLIFPLPLRIFFPPLFAYIFPSLFPQFSHTKYSREPAAIKRGKKTFPTVFAGKWSHKGCPGDGVCKCGWLWVVFRCQAALGYVASWVRLFYVCTARQYWRRKNNKFQYMVWH